jgi:hypothetical protein
MIARHPKSGNYIIGISGFTDGRHEPKSGDSRQLIRVNFVSLSIMDNLLNSLPLATITTESGDSLIIELETEGTRDRAVLYINGVPHFLERIPNAEFTTQYNVDNDPDYRPMTDGDGHCFMLIPFSV